MKKTLFCHLSYILSPDVFHLSEEQRCSVPMSSSPVHQKWPRMSLVHPVSVKRPCLGQSPKLPCVEISLGQNFLASKFPCAKISLCQNFLGSSSPPPELAQDVTLCLSNSPALAKVQNFLVSKFPWVKISSCQNFIMSSLLPPELAQDVTLCLSNSPALAKVQNFHCLIVTSLRR